MELRFDGKVALITGAGSGLGRAHALLLGSRGASVVVNDIGVGADGNSLAEAVVAEITAQGGRAIADRNSVATGEGGESMVRAAVESFGSIDIVLNNAGIVRDKTFAKMTLDQVAAVIDVHLIGAFNVTLPAFRHMKERRYGRIVSTTSAAGLFGNFGQTNYGAAKAGLIGMTRVLALECAAYNIRANVVAPIAATSMSAGLLDAEWERRLRPELVSPVVAYLCHESCDLNGEILSAAAGRVARVFIGVGEGIYSPDLTVEDIRDNLAAIMSEDSYSVPMSAAGERDLLEKAFRKAEQA